VPIIGGAHLNAQANLFVVLLGEIENQLQIIGKLQASRPGLNFPPGWANIKLLPQGESNQILDGLRNVVRLDLLGTHIRGDVGDQPLAIAGYNLFGRRGGHDHFIAGNDGVRRILREWALIQAVSDGRTGAEVVFAPVMGWDQPMRALLSQLRDSSKRNRISQKFSAAHESRSPRAPG
jgi:hypothetical protein